MGSRAEEGHDLEPDVKDKNQEEQEMAFSNAGHMMEGYVVSLFPLSPFRIQASCAILVLVDNMQLQWLFVF